MYFSPRTKQTNTTPTNHSYRGYRVSPSNRMNFSPVEPYINDQDFYTYRASPQTSEFYENSHPMSQNVKSSGCYRTKRPADMAEIIDHDRFYALNHSVASPYESRNYNHYDNSQDGIRPGMSCLSTRAGPYREEDRFFDHIEANNATYRGAPASTREKANARYLAEKVYAMKMRPQGIMASLAPLARSKSPNHGSTFISSKNTTPVNSQSALREAGDNGYGEPVVRVGDTSLLDMSNRNRNGLQKGNGTSSQKSIGQGRNEKGQESQMKRVNSSGRFQKSPMRSPERWDGQVVMYQGVRKERNMNMMRMKILEFEEKIHTTMWQVCQRNKRLVLVTLLEGLHYHKLKVAQHFKKKAHMTKAKYFCLWQNFLLGMNLERQRMQQEKQNALAIRFYYKKLLKKSFRNLKDITTPKPKTLQQTPAIHYSSAKDLRQVGSPTMKTAVNQNKPGSRNSSQTRSQTPQNISNKRVPQTDKVIEKTQKKSTSKERTPSAPRQATGTKVITKGTCAPLSSRTSSNHQVVAAKNDTNKIVESIETPDFPTNQFPFPVPTFGKAPLRYYEPSEIQELTELSQSPQKGPTSYKNSGLDQSFGCDNLDQSGENVKGAAFDSILSEILQGSEGNVDRKRENTLAVSLQGKGKDTVKKTVKIDNASVKKNNFVGKQGSPPKTARNHSSPGRKGKDVKDYGGSMTTRGKNEGVQDSPQFAKVCKVDKAKILENRKMKESKSNKCLEEEDVKLEEKMRFAGSHYVNNLKIKALSGLLENYVQVFKDRELYQKHYERNLLKNSFGAWSEVVMGEAGSEETVSEDTYNEIVERFRFIMLTEKAMRQWKELTRNNKRKLGMR